MSTEHIAKQRLADHQTVIESKVVTALEGTRQCEYGTQLWRADVIRKTDEVIVKSIGWMRNIDAVTFEVSILLHDLGAEIYKQDEAEQDQEQKESAEAQAEREVVL